MINKFLSFFEDSYENKQKHFKNSQIIFNLMKFFSFLILTYVSLNLSMDLFKEFGSTQKDTNFFVLTILGLELSKIIALVLAKSEFYTRQFKNILIGIGFSILFIGLGFVSVFSSYGFVLVATEKTAASNIALSTESDIAFYQEKLDVVNKKIEAYLPQLQRGDLAISSKEKIEKQMQVWELEKEEYYTSIRNLQKQTLEKESTKESVGMFGLMARDMNIDEKKLRFWMMFILVLVIELCITVMSPHISIIKPERNMDQEIESKRKELETLTQSLKTPVIEKTIIEEPIKAKKPIVEIKLEEPVIEKEVIIEEPKEEVVHVRETAFEKFVKASFDNGKNTWLKDRLEVAQEIGIPPSKAIQYHNLLSTFKKENGYTLIEFRKDTGKWHPNYTDQVILNIYKEGILKVEETNASKA
jgi:hypothetical protein